MIDIAQKYSSILQEKFLDTVYDEKYKFYHGSYASKYEPSNDTWCQHEFVSLNNNGDVLGYIAYSIDRNSYATNNLRIINFSDNKILFGKDVMKVLSNIFLKYNFRKLDFSVYVGNPIEKTYDKLINKYGGRIIGFYKEDTRLSDGKLYDLKLYEIFKDDYLKNIDYRGE